jgi:hypothetical protein
MNFGLQELLIASGAILATWIFNNVKLREGVTDWFVSRLGVDSYNISNHNVKENIKSLKLEAVSTQYDNEIKEELYLFYVELVLNNMIEIIDDILLKEKKMSFEELKKHIKNTVYDKLDNINVIIKNKIQMPSELQNKFDKFKNYLTLQHSYAIEHALQSPNKKLLLIQVFDAIENNNRWFLFYSTEMFDNFNGHFDTLTRADVFKN